MGGITAFTPPPGESYRDVIELKNETRSILPGNLASKKYKGGISKDDYVTSANAIPGASVIDYVKVNRCASLCYRHTFVY
ncbi:hypothetical protein BBJ29_009943 [Phytophthora kernoviae]|uniref:Uncharacterized protein n=1 Tax=Phytophthora kernoviae TaxID=325452 RepID=A0A3F2RBA9_9STRA|nr:hypothetical protein BBP00_00009897 [Phytophthora kernoviae]RLN57311.1 hypothetical protein BBJ29_009943 [Phytophthora kernoviae]